MASRPAKWKVLASRYVQRDEWISLRADDCETAEGTRVSPYYVLEYPDWATVAAFDQQRRLVLVNQYRHGIGDFSLELPGGVVDTDLETPQAAVEREFLEETGYRAAKFEFLGSYCPNPATHTNLAHFFLATGCQKIQEPVLELAETLEVKIFEPQEVVAMIHKQQFRQAHHVSNILLALERLGHLHFRW